MFHDALVPFAERQKIIMKKRTFKKILTMIASTILFSSTIVYAREYSYQYTLYQTQIVYTNLVIKESEDDFAHIEPKSLNGAFQMTVVNTYNNAKTITSTIYPTTGNKRLHYGGKAIAGDYLKLKIENYPADNAGRICSIQGIWIP